MYKYRGQIFLRDAGRHPNGRRLVMFTGIISVPDDFDLPCESQYTFAGNEMPGGHLSMVVVNNPVDLRDVSLAQGIDGLLTSPIWRI